MKLDNNARFFEHARGRIQRPRPRFYSARPTLSAGKSECEQTHGRTIENLLAAENKLVLREKFTDIVREWASIPDSLSQIMTHMKMENVNDDEVSTSCARSWTKMNT